MLLYCDLCACEVTLDFLFESLHPDSECDSQYITKVLRKFWALADVTMVLKDKKLKKAKHIIFQNKLEE